MDAKDIINGKPGILAFAAEEFLEIHRLCDSLNIVVALDGNRLSVSQRVAALVAKHNDLAYRMESLEK